MIRQSGNDFFAAVVCGHQLGKKKLPVSGRKIGKMRYFLNYDSKGFSVKTTGMIRAAVVLALLLGSAQVARAQALDTVQLAALPAPRLVFSQREMQLAQAVAGDPEALQRGIVIAQVELLQLGEVVAAAYGA